METRSAIWAETLTALTEVGCATLDDVQRRTGAADSEIRPVLREMTRLGWVVRTARDAYEPGEVACGTLATLSEAGR